MNISDEAVEAAARRIYLDSPTGRRTCEAWEGLDEGAQSYYRLSARVILEAAGPFIAAEAWHRGYVSALNNMEFNGIPTPNPYRSQA